MLTTAQIDEYRTRGFLRGPRVLDDATIETLRKDVLRVIENRDAGGAQPVIVRNIARNAEAGAAVWQIVDIWQASEPFRALVHHPEIVGAVAQLSGAAQLRLWHDQIQYKPAESGGVNMWHQDGPYWPILKPKTQLTAWVALDDVDVDNGCMSMVPGSHRWGDTIDVLHGLKDYRSMPAEWNGHRIEVVPCPVKAGCVHFHDALTWHGSHENTSGRPRRAIALHYMTEATRYDAAGTHLMKPFVTVADGAKLEGPAFPLVFDGGRVVPAETAASAR